MIRTVRKEDAEELAAIYNYYIEQTTISFEETALKTVEMADRIIRISSHFPYLVYEEGGTILAYAYTHTFRERSAYRFTVEDTVYIRHGYERRGIGKKMLSAVTEETKQRGFHSIVACITEPNVPSVALHEQSGFTARGVLHQAGYKFGRWLDVGFWEKLL